MALLQPGDKILSMELSSGGHLSHGAKPNFSSRVYKFYNYGLNSTTDLIDYENLEKIAKEKLMSNKYQMIILDEINYVLDYQFFPLEEFLETLRNKPKDVHVVCSGRNANEKLIEMADLVTEMKLVKHPYDDQGIPAQKGIEF